MASYSRHSLRELATCVLPLQETFLQIIPFYNHRIIQGHRGEAEQNNYYYTGRSKVRYPNSKHNTSPSLAVDVAPWLPGRGIPWPKEGTKTYHKDYWEFVLFAGVVICEARHQGHIVTWGGDWDRDFQVTDNKFDDLVHFQYEGELKL